VSGNGNRIKSKMAAKYRDKRTSITTARDQYPSYDIFPTFKSTVAFLCSKDILSQKSEVELMISWGHFAGHPSAVETKKDARMVVCAMPRQGRIYFRKPVF
jgi:hypothetical protein